MMGYVQGEVETDACKDYKEQNPVSEALSAPDELKKIHLELEIQKARSEEKMIPTHQKRKMFAAQRKLAREQKDEEDEEDVHRIRTELVGLSHITCISEMMTMNL